LCRDVRLRSCLPACSGMRMAISHLPGRMGLRKWRSRRMRGLRRLGRLMNMGRNSGAGPNRLALLARHMLMARNLPGLRPPGLVTFITHGASNMLTFATLPTIAQIMAKAGGKRQMLCGLSSKH